MFLFSLCDFLLPVILSDKITVVRYGLVQALDPVLSCFSVDFLCLFHLLKFHV